MSDTDITHVVKEGFGSVHRRIDDFIGVSSQRHTEVVTKIDAVSEGLGIVANRVTRVETRADLITPKGHPENGHVSLVDLKWYLAIAGGAIGGTLAALKIMGKL
jgi:hypothetical protein